MLNNVEAVRAAITIVNSEAGGRGVERLMFIVENAFEGLDVRGKAVLDVGCGRGILSFAAAADGAKCVVSLEPEVDGSTKGVASVYRRIQTRMGYDNLKLISAMVQDYDFADGPFDIVLMHNCINHIDEAACVNYRNDKASRGRYVNLFRRLHDNIVSGGKLMFADMSNRNLFGDLRVTNPIAKTIEWNKHQAPEVWFEGLVEAGFRQKGVHWTPLYALGVLRPLFRLRLFSYITNSHFVALAERP
jgi:SAM-dependent methyltransferase